MGKAPVLPASPALRALDSGLVPSPNGTVGGICPVPARAPAGTFWESKAMWHLTVTPSLVPSSYVALHSHPEISSQGTLNSFLRSLGTLQF